MKSKNMSEKTTTGVVKNGKLFVFGVWYEIEHVKGHVVKTAFEGQIVKAIMYPTRVDPNPSSIWIYCNNDFEVWQKCR